MKRSSILGIIAILAIFVTAVFVLAAAADSPEINACVKRNGRIRIVDSADDCRRGEEHLSWNIAGPQGPPGDLNVYTKATPYTLTTVHPGADGIFEQQSVSCDPGDIATGGGHEMTEIGQQGDIIFFVLLSSSPTFDNGRPSGWEVWYTNSALENPKTWGITVHVICQDAAP